MGKIILILFIFILSGCSQKEKINNYSIIKTFKGDINTEIKYEKIQDKEYNHLFLKIKFSEKYYRKFKNIEINYNQNITLNFRDKDKFIIENIEFNSLEIVSDDYKKILILEYNVNMDTITFNKIKFIDFSSNFLFN